MDEEYLGLLLDLHKRQNRQGPGGEAETEKAINLAGIDREQRLRLADIGCGTGASTLLLAQSLNAEVTAVDFLPEFIQVLEANAESEGLSDKIKPIICSMEDLPFVDGEFDVIWSEGAIYNMGFEKGVEAWRRFLKPGGVLVASEITWITSSRPVDLQKYWEDVYPEIDTASSKIKVLEDCGYTPVGYFVLPEYCWLEKYYRPLQQQLPAFVAKHEGNETAAAIAASEKNEYELYLNNKLFYSYGFYIARKTSE